MATMDDDEFIASPSFICRALNSTNRERALQAIKKCPRCHESTRTHADVLLDRNDGCYQIIFECLVCSLRVDIMEDYTYQPRDLLAPGASALSKGPSEDEDLRKSSSHSSSSSGKQKISFTLGKTNGTTPKTANGHKKSSDEAKDKIKIQLGGTKRPLPPAVFDEDEAAPFKKADEAFTVKKQVEASKYQIIETLKKDEEYRRRKRLLEEAELQLYLETADNKLRENRLLDEQRLHNIVAGERHSLAVIKHDWSESLRQFRNPNVRFGYHMEKIQLKARVLIRAQTPSAPQSKNTKNLTLAALEQARDWKFRKELEYSEDLVRGLTAAFEQDERKGWTYT